jgi:hypothetical protein
MEYCIAMIKMDSCIINHGYRHDLYHIISKNGIILLNG